jgi:hypothetical protein
MRTSDSKADAYFYYPSYSLIVNNWDENGIFYPGFTSGAGASRIDATPSEEVTRNLADRREPIERAAKRVRSGGCMA